MKILIFSDSHGAVSGMLEAVEKYDPVMVVHLGDNVSDGDMLASVCTGLPVRQVLGNCDFPREGVPSEQTVTVGGKKLFVCHGRIYCSE